MARGVKVPRVTIPRDTKGVYDLAVAVTTAMEAQALFDDGEPNYIQAGWEIKEALQTAKTALGVAYFSAVEKEADAKQARANAAVAMNDALDELRNARDLILALNPTDPMEIGQYGFEAFMSTSSNGGGGGTEPDPEVDENGDPIVIVPA